MGLKLARKLYDSPNGDQWHLVRDPDSGRVFIKHRANLPSGGHVTDIEIGAFLNQGKGPEHQELLRLIGSLVEDTAPEALIESGPGANERRGLDNRSA